MKKTLYCLLFSLCVAGCGESSREPTDTAGSADGLAGVTAEVEAYYAANPDFFSFKTPADLPPDLVWENNNHLPEIGSPDAIKGGTQNAAMQDFPRTLRTVGPDSNGGFRAYLLDDTGMTMAHLHPETRDLYPGLAESWAIDEAARTVYVKLDPAARFSDGEPVTADDYLFMFWFYRSPYIMAPWYNNFYSTTYTNITRYDDYTISITTRELKPDLDERVLLLRPIPQHFYTDMGDDFSERYQWEFEPTPGAYIIRPEDVRKGRSIALTRNKDWWAKDKKYWRYRFNPDRIQFTVIRDDAKTFEAFKRGDIDQFGLGLAEYWYEKLPDSDPDIQAGYIHKVMYYNQRPRPNFGLWINTAQPLLSDRDIRLGINYATNWELVIEKFFRGDNTRMNTGQEGFGEFTHPTITARTFDISKAQAHFAAAGFTERGADGILVNDQGQRLAFTLSTGYESLRDVLTILREEAAKAGLDLRIEVLDGTVGWKKVQEKQHDIFFTAFGVFLELYPRFWEHYHSDNAYDRAFLDDGSVNPERKLKTQTNNLESFAILEMDQLIERYRRSSDRDEMIQLAHRMTEMHHEHASFVPGFYQGFFRIGHWRWLRYPEGFSHKHAQGPGEAFVHWIDTDMKAETEAARRDGTRFDPVIRVHDQWAE
ncbi:MAG: ABC transporter substrate-binding protein [Haliea sp.]|uniref:extracellular solute-binding protein n=1 Tax=Haliea sp. TaxID=1932666 RepID=UPI000C41129D|nr:extracellular solute-binding protein [Haliea sp.]MBM69436.1 ABC transporter substrate-binding protein [Haliea sp.]|tara:strand:- start:2549 stop:4504 length:1956 start_codon:yes stop_codon:yes gene_type:complete